MNPAMRCLLTVVAAVTVSAGSCFAQQLTEANYDQLVPQGKEIDAIYGDYSLSNAKAKAVIAAPKSSRNANMTVRSIGGGLIDLATTGHESDQLSCFYPGRRRFPFSKVSANQDSVTMTSPGSDERPKCEVRYEMMSGQPVIKVTSTWTNTTSQDWTLALEDDIRADGGKEDMMKSVNGTHDLLYIHDIYWQQAYGIRADGYKIRCTSNSRESVLRYETGDGENPRMKPGESFTFERQIIVGKNLPEVLATADRMSGKDVSAITKVTVHDKADQPVAGARVKLSSGDSLRGTIVTDTDGVASAELPDGTYTVNVECAGTALFPEDTVTLKAVSGQNHFMIKSANTAFGKVSATIIDAKGRPIPAKTEFIGGSETPTPDWGPDTAEHFVRNLAYTANGSFETSLAAGQYDIIISHGPEYDAVFTKLEVAAGETSELKAVLRRVVKTPGWVSSDFHSHSSPSGDNTGSQKGRVLNLAAEHIEFAPCTEHNRVSTYTHHIAELGLEPFMATVSGMELTGRPLPLNHQNAFPMKYTPRTQDGGGPVTDDSPESQIERLALWDNRSEKLIQQNHPDMGWLFYDKNGDANPDEGHSRSFPLMDVMEIHPIDRILDITKFDIRNGKPFNNNRMLNWLQLLNQGFRIYGVVNTDAHYNFHGSGWLRNWIQSGTDDPAKIDSDEMVKASEQGRLVMSNGPYLEASFQDADGSETVVSGQDLAAKSGKVKVHIRVQCANWLDIDTVFLLINGSRAEDFTFTRPDNPDLFSDDVVKFDRTLTVPLEQDAHIVVVTGHRSAQLGDVMGPSGGTQHPAALTNPVFVDINGDGFQPGKDTLGHPLPVKFAAP